MSILHEILDVKKEEVKKLRQEFTYSRFADTQFFSQSRLSITDALTKTSDISIIAEIKKASPSKGVLIENFDHLKIADVYFENEVNAVSILTDKNFFKGDIKFLNDIAKIKAAPLLRKDFIIDEYQILEAKSNGADVILLIAEALSENQIKELTHAAFENDLEVLLELHSKEQLQKIDFTLNKLLGINNRDLETFNVDLNTTRQIIESVPESITVVSESGINTRKDIDFLLDTRTDAVLVGEHFMKSGNIADSIKQLKDWCRRES